MTPTSSAPPLTADIAARIEAWFPGAARDLPWREPLGFTASRGARRDPYRVLVSELMLQQTQVSRVIEKFDAFLTRFPTVAALAGADEADVLASWSGLGYYRRARHLHAAAKAVQDSHAGEVPAEAEVLRTLPGVGRYTAGSIASIAFGRREPLVDGNVVRVLLRVHGRDGAAGEHATLAWTWERAADLVTSARDPGVLNEGLMELGATVCVPQPAAPKCGVCPLAPLCVSRRENTQQKIPRPKAAARKRELYCASVVVEDARGNVLVEQRGDGAMWAGMWQAPTVEREDREPTRAEARRLIAKAGAGVVLARAESFEHQTTHRRVRFTVYVARVPRRSNVRADAGGRARRWIARADLGSLGISNPQRAMLVTDRSLN